MMVVVMVVVVAVSQLSALLNKCVIVAEACCRCRCLGQVSVKCRGWLAAVSCQYFGAALRKATA